MIKVLVIDDEPMQRQGIVRMTPWTDFDAEVVGDTGSGKSEIYIALIAQALAAGKQALTAQREPEATPMG